MLTLKNKVALLSCIAALALAMPAYAQDAIVPDSGAATSPLSLSFEPARTAEGVTYLRAGSVTTLRVHFNDTGSGEAGLALYFLELADANDGLKVLEPTLWFKLEVSTKEDMLQKVEITDDMANRAWLLVAVADFGEGGIAMSPVLAVVVLENAGAPASADGQDADQHPQEEPTKESKEEPKQEQKEEKAAAQEPAHDDAASEPQKSDGTIVFGKKAEPRQILHDDQIEPASEDQQKMDEAAHDALVPDSGK